MESNPIQQRALGGLSHKQVDSSFAIHTSATSIASSMQTENAGNIQLSNKRF